MIRKLALVCVAATVLCANALAQDTAFTKASDWVGREVITLDGDRVGEVEDFALDLASGEIHYVVVSVGSFLIDDSLIAVSLDALNETAGSDSLTLNAEDVAAAKRFAGDRWPAHADVLAVERLAEDDNAEPPPATRPAVINDRGTATISSGRKRATLSARERRIERIETPVVVADYNEGLTPTSPKAVTRLPSFERLDVNKDDAISRREIGARLSQNESYDAIDSDASGRIDRFEFEVFTESRQLDEQP